MRLITAFSSHIREMKVVRPNSAKNYGTYLRWLNWILNNAGQADLCERVAVYKAGAGADVFNGLPDSTEELQELYPPVRPKDASDIISARRCFVLHCEDAFRKYAAAKVNDFEIERTQPRENGGDGPRPAAGGGALPPVIHPPVLWRDWPPIDPDFELVLAREIARTSIFPHPGLVNHIVDSNNQLGAPQNNGLLNQFPIQWNSWLWPNCPTVYLGVRRCVGNAMPRGIVPPELREEYNAIEFDANQYAYRVLNSLLFGQMTIVISGQRRLQPPPGFQVCHLAGHKDHRQEALQTIFDFPDGAQTLYGMFTSAANLVYIPSAIAGATDWSTNIQLLLLHRAQELYGEFCSLWPENYQLHPLPDDWALENFDWREPTHVGHTVTNLLDARHQFLENRAQN